MVQNLVQFPFDVRQAVFYRVQSSLYFHGT
jgi:hypothetical protein